MVINVVMLQFAFYFLVKKKKKRGDKPCQALSKAAGPGSSGVDWIGFGGVLPSLFRTASLESALAALGEILIFPGKFT